MLAYQINNAYICINKTPRIAQNTKNRGFKIKRIMKVQKFSELHARLSLFPAQDFELFKNRFYQSDLGKIYNAIPWDEMI